jgi:predicted homoserine dehydrogenase-like protein
VRRCFAEYGVKTDASGRYACLYKRWHLIGLELGISVASVALRGEATGCADAWRADAVAVAKRDLEQCELLDGEGGYTVVGQLMSSSESHTRGCLPLGLAQGALIRQPLRAGQVITWGCVALDETLPAVRLRRELERGTFPP